MEVRAINEYTTIGMLDVSVQGLLLNHDLYSECPETSNMWKLRCASRGWLDCKQAMWLCDGYA